MKNLTEDQKKAIVEIANMVKKTHAFDYIDDCIEVRLYDEAKELFSQTVYPD